MSEIVDCINGLTFTDIIRLISKEGTHIQVSGAIDDFEELGDGEWRFGCDDDGDFVVENKFGGTWWLIFEY